MWGGLCWSTTGFDRHQSAVQSILIVYLMACTEWVALNGGLISFEPSACVFHSAHGICTKKWPAETHVRLQVTFLKSKKKTRGGLAGRAGALRAGHLQVTLAICRSRSLLRRQCAIFSKPCAFLKPGQAFCLLVWLLINDASSPQWRWRFRSVVSYIDHKMIKDELIDQKMIKDELIDHQMIKGWTLKIDFGR